MSDKIIIEDIRLVDLDRPEIHLVNKENYADLNPDVEEEIHEIGPTRTIYRRKRWGWSLSEEKLDIYLKEEDEEMMENLIKKIKSIKEKEAYLNGLNMGRIEENTKIANLPWWDRLFKNF